MSVEQFPQRLRGLMDEAEKKKYIISDLCGLDRSTLRRYARGEVEPGRAALEAIADCFGVSADYLMGRTDNREVNR